MAQGPPKGSQFWKLAVFHPGPATFLTPTDLYDKCCEYFQWVDDNPLYEEKVVGSEGKTIELRKMRAASIKSLCLFLGVSRVTWYKYAKKPGFDRVCEMVADILYEYKFAGAAAGLLHPVIIARDLNLREKSDVELTGKNGGPIELSDVQRAERIEAILERARQARARQSVED
jgi:antitoxin component of MazEF toxin-antitoxin module